MTGEHIVLGKYHLSLHPAVNKFLVCAAFFGQVFIAQWISGQSSFEFAAHLEFLPIVICLEILSFSFQPERFWIDHLSNGGGMTTFSSILVNVGFVIMVFNLQSPPSLPDPPSPYSIKSQESGGRGEHTHKLFCKSKMHFNALVSQGSLSLSWKQVGKGSALKVPTSAAFMGFFWCSFDMYLDCAFIC